MAGKKIAIIGLGGVGGYFGFKLSKRNEDIHANEIIFIARGDTYKILIDNGLTLLSPEHAIPTTWPDHVTENLDDVREADLIMICVKEYDLEHVCLQLKTNIHKNTVILALMNGVDIYDRIRKIISDAIVLPACVYVASHIKEKGIVEHKGIAGKIILGKDPMHVDFEPNWIFDILKDSGIDVVYRENPFPDIWTKFMFIASFGLVSARYNKSIGQVIETADLKARASSIMHEIRSIAIDKGIHLDENSVELTFKKAATFPYHTPTSLQLDVHSKKGKNELELFAGAIINYGKLLNVPIVETKKIYDEISDELRLR